MTGTRGRVRRAGGLPTTYRGPPGAGRVAELCVEPDGDVRVGSPVLVLDVP